MGVARTALDAALKYLDLGWALIPLTPRGKEPFVELLPRDASGRPSWKPLATHPATHSDVKAWFREHPDMNLGILCGQPSGGLVVVDVDHQPNKPLHLPPTVAAKTGRGTHYYYRAGGRIKTTGYDWGEVRGDGAYVVAPPSMHPSGSRYEWCDWCSPDAHPLADLPDEYIISPLSNPLGGTARTNIGTCCRDRGEGIWAQWLTREDVAIRIMELCGVSGIRLGKAFRCPLPGHEERSPSASLYRHADGYIIMRDFHERSGRPWWTLAEVYASVRAGQIMRLDAGGRAIWLLRALCEAGFLQAPALLAPRLPAGVKQSVQDVYKGFCELLAIRSLYDPSQAAAPFSWRFAAAWCGRNQRTCAEAIQWLLGAGYLRIVGETGGRRKTALLALGTPHQQRRNEDESKRIARGAAGGDS